jgi:hypothetical protein
VVRRPYCPDSSAQHGYSNREGHIVGGHLGTARRNSWTGLGV